MVVLQTDYGISGAYFVGVGAKNCAAGAADDASTDVADGQADSHGTVAGDGLGGADPSLGVADDPSHAVADDHADYHGDDDAVGSADIY